MKTPILFIVFNRPDATAQVFSAIRKAKPKKLFIAADGPREKVAGEKDLCDKVRDIVENVDWPCEVKRLFRSKNLGCRLAVSGAIDWFFNNVEEGIILEDDCLPTQSFFKFCTAMLSKYHRDESIMHISGSNFQRPENKINNNYYFSKYVHVWGWASWRRAWKKYDVGMKDWPRIKAQDKINYVFNSVLEREYWYTILESVFQGKIDTWDYQWVYSIWKNRGGAITPCVNLIENIGHGKNSTHMSLRKLQTQTEQMKFPAVLLKDRQKQNRFDNYISKSHYGINLPMVIYQKAKLLIGNLN